MSFIIVTEKFRVTIATNCRALTCWMNINYVAGHEQVRNILFQYTIICMGNYRRDLRLEIKFTAHFNTRLVTTLNYSAIADLHTLQITTAYVKSFYSVFTSRSLVTATNSEDSSASAFTSLPAGSQLHRLSLPFTNSLTTLSELLLQSSSL
jgi:hypothetical protein